MDVDTPDKIDDNEDDDTSALVAKKPKMMLESISKKINIKTRGKVFGVVRENYLRSDLACRSQLCFEVKQKSQDTGCVHYNFASK